ncbi:hypothetical protein [Gorillibacterium sp. sgz5001074]|uniref:hypothetical protein n=1 Tax=Gorillibacterium sp. sgz5001074 TaxID=3446695 RepID=UPI003F67BCDD
MRPLGRLLTPVISLSILLAACQAGRTGPEAVGPASAPSVPAATAEASSPEPGDSVLDAAGLAGSQPDAAESLGVTLPEQDISLLPAEPEGAVLRIGSKERRMNWIFTTPRRVLPVLQVHDYDADGEAELAVVLSIGSGTGVSVEELHLIEYQGAEAAGALPFADHIFKPEEYLGAIRESIVFQKISRNGEWLGQIQAGGRTGTIPLSDMVKEYGVAHIRDELGFGSIVHFRAEGGDLVFSAAIGLLIEGVAEPQYIGTVEAPVSYASRHFTLGPFRYIEEG